MRAASWECRMSGTTTSTALVGRPAPRVTSLDTGARYQWVDSTLSVGRSPGQWFTPALGAEEPALAELHKHEVSGDRERENPEEIAHPTFTSEYRLARSKGQPRE